MIKNRKDDLPPVRRVLLQPNNMTMGTTCAHCQHMVQLCIEHEVERLHLEFQSRERDLMEQLVGKIQRVSALEE